jgi:hypothetical protein
LVALDLAMPKPSVATRPNGGSADVRPGKFILNLKDLQPVDASGAKEGASTQAAHYRADADGNRYRLKFNANRPNVTFHEIFASQLLNAIGFSCAPKAALVGHSVGKLGAGPNDVWIASPELKGFEDVGRFLIESGAKHVAHSLEGAYRKHVARHSEALAEADAQLARPAVKALMDGYKKGGVDTLTAGQHADLQPLRDSYRHALQAQDKMFDLLPPAFRRELLSACYASEIVGNWDFMNHERANTGFTVKEDGTVRAHTVDFGNSGPIGFGGKLKSESLAAARQPARIDDPHLHVPGPLAPAGYAQDNLDERDVQFETVSPTFGLVGQLPRSAVLAPFLAPILHQERDSDPSGALSRAAPDEALEVAWHLSKLPSGSVSQFAKTMFEQGKAHADGAIAQLFSSATTAFRDSDALAQAYQQRIDGIIDRAMRGDQLQRWASRNPEQATRIAQHVAQMTTTPAG